MNLTIIIWHYQELLRNFVSLITVIWIDQVYGNFQHQGDSLFIQCYSINEEIEDTIAVEEGFGFKPFNNIRVKIEILNGDILVLSKDGQKWNFRKY